MAHREYEELLTLEALGALGAGDKRALDEHLETCSECRAELAELRDAAGLLAHASTPAEPGAAVRARILSAASADRRSAKQTEAPSNVVPIASRRRADITKYLLRTAAVVTIVGLILGLAILNHRIADLTGETVAKQRELDREREGRRHYQEALELMNSRDARKMELAGTQTAQNARGFVIFDKKSGKAMLMAEGLPAAPAGMAYEVWFIPKGQSPMPGKTFTVDLSGHATMMDQVPMEARDNAVVAVTLEPRGGSPSPTGPIYLASPAS